MCVFIVSHATAWFCMFPRWLSSNAWPEPAIPPGRLSQIDLSCMKRQSINQSLKPAERGTPVTGGISETATLSLLHSRPLVLCYWTQKYRCTHTHTHTRTYIYICDKSEKKLQLAMGCWGEQWTPPLKMRGAHLYSAMTCGIMPFSTRL